MVEDIGKIIRNGFETYTRNLNLSIPFVLSFFISGLIALPMIGLGFLYILGSSLSDITNAKSPEAIALILIPLIMQHILEIGVLFVIILLVVLFIQAYFTSGAIGMAIQATESGNSDLSSMRYAGKKNLVNMFLAEILFSLLSLLGIVFIVPGAMKIDISQFPSSENIGALALLLGGFLLWVIYLIVISLLFAVFRYSLVADNLGPLESMTASLSFFKKNKSDVVLLFVFVIVINIALIIIDQIFGSIPIISIIWSIINFVISLIVIPPLTTIWWVRLFMARTDRKLYLDELLAHPNELNNQ